MASILFKYTIFLLNLLLFSQARLENKSKILVLSCSKLLNQKFKDQPKSEDFTKMMLSCFIKISQDQAQKISDRKESDSLPLKPEEINELFNIDNLKGIPEEEIKSNSELMNKFIQEIEDSEKNIRRLVDMDNDNLAGKAVEGNINNLIKNPYYDLLFDKCVKASPESKEEILKNIDKEDMSSLNKNFSFKNYEKNLYMILGDGKKQGDCVWNLLKENGDILWKDIDYLVITTMTLEDSNNIMCYFLFLYL